MAATTKLSSVRPARAAVTDPAMLRGIAHDTLLECFAERARHGRRIAFRIENLHEPVRAVSRAELADGLEQAARRLRRLGVRRGDRVMLVLPTSADFVTFFWGALRAAATPVPAYPPAGWRQLAAFADSLGRMVAATRARLVIVPAVLRDLLHDNAPPGLAGTKIVAPEDVWAAAPAADLPAPPGPEDLALIQFSSGSTGDPRGICLTQTNLLSNIRGFAQRMVLQRDDVLVSWLPLYHDMGLIGTMIAPLAIGMPLVLFPPTDFLRDPAFWLRVMGRYGATISVAPQFAYSLCDRKVDPRMLADVDLSPLRILLNGAEPIHAADLAAFQKRYRRLGLRRNVVTPCYGLAEGTLAVCMRPPERALTTRRRRSEDEVGTAGHDPLVASVGPPLDGVEVRVRAADGKWQPDLAVGEICVRAPSVCSGHLTPAGVVPAVDSHGWLHTGDLGFLSRGELYVTGRKKDLIIIGGRNLYPQEIEAEVGALPGFRPGRVAAFGVDDAARGTEVLVVVAESHERGTADPAAALAAVRQRLLAQFGIAPHDVVLVGRGELPLTSSGKLRRFEARAAYERGALESVIHRLQAPAPRRRARAQRKAP